MKYLPNCSQSFLTIASAILNAYSQAFLDAQFINLILAGQAHQPIIFWVISGILDIWKKAFFLKLACFAAYLKGSVVSFKSIIYS